MNTSFKNNKIFIIRKIINDDIILGIFIYYSLSFIYIQDSLFMRVLSLTAKQLILSLNHKIFIIKKIVNE